MFNSHQSIPLLLLFAQCCLSTGETITPQALQWSPKSYGPDGPWHAVSINIGTSLQTVDLFPGGSWTSNILAPSVCPKGPSCSIPSSAGFYDSTLSETSISIDEAGTVNNTTITDTPWTGSAQWVLDTISVPILDRFTGLQNNATIQDFDMLVVVEANETLPDGTTYPAQVGKLALGLPHFNQTGLRSPPNSNRNGTSITSALYENNLVPSNSYGMHIGSSTLGIPGSLTFGGYDQSRVLGPVSTQVYEDDHLPIQLLDIGIGVAEGGSPFPFTTKSGLLSEGNSSLNNALTINIAAPLPYLYLPQSTCNAITQYLPVTFDSKYGLYIWNTTSPLYSTIITSPSFLSFTFSLNSNLSQNFTINVPFSLLNLTLTAPIVKTPTPYFPCRPAQGPTGSFELGRAFLQAAFIGVNWNSETVNGSWFLAQAPGPGLPANVEATTIHPGDDAIVSSTDQWKDTWKGVWTVLPETGNNTSNTPLPASPTETELKKTSIVPIVAGISGTVLLASMAISIILCIRWKRWKLSVIQGQPDRFEPDSHAHGHDDSYADFLQRAGRSTPSFGPKEIESEVPLRELDGRTRWTMARPVEMAA